MSDLIFEIENNIAFIKLNRPESLNAFSFEMIQDWISSLEEIRDNENINVGVITGNGKAFCAGGDVKSMIAEEGFMKQSQSEKFDFNSKPINTKDSLWK